MSPRTSFLQLESTSSSLFIQPSVTQTVTYLSDGNLHGTAVRETRKERSCPDAGRAYGS